MMRQKLSRKLAIGVTGALMTALALVAVAPVAAQDAPSTQDAAVIEAQATLDGATGSVAVGYPGPIYTVTNISGNLPAVETDPDGETSGAYQIDYSAARDSDTGAGAQSGS